MYGPSDKAIFAGLALVIAVGAVLGILVSRGCEFVADHVHVEWHEGGE